MDLLLKKLLYISVSLILYLTSLSLPYYTGGDDSIEQISGLQQLTDGHAGFCTALLCVNPFSFIAWLANFPFALGLSVLVFSRSPKQFKLASVILFIALIMSLGSLIAFVGNHTLYAPSIGSFVWIFSLLLMWAGAHLLNREYTSPAID